MGVRRCQHALCRAQGLRLPAQDQVHLLVEASSRPVVGTPLTLLHPTRPQAVEEELRNEIQHSADLRNQLQRLTAELLQVRARSANLAAKVINLLILQALY